MKIVLFTSKKTSSLITPRIKELLSGQIRGADIIEKVSRTNLDVVKDIMGAGSFDLGVVVIHYGRESSDVAVLMHKLVDLDLAGKHLLKYIENDEDVDEEEEPRRIADEIIVKLFGKKKQKSFEGKGSYKGL